MYIIIIGAGEVGCYVARVLVNEGHDVVIVEANPAIARQLDSSMNALVVTGSGVNPAVLEQGGIAQADLLLAVTSIDEVNLIACMTGRKHGRRSLRTVARVRWSWQSAGDPALSAADLDLDALVSSHRAIAAEALNALRYIGTGEIRELASGKVVLVGMALAADSPLVHESLAEVRKDFDQDFLVVAVQGRDGVRIPSGADRLQVEDRAFVMALPDSTTELAILSGQPFAQVRRVMIIGCGDTGLHVAQELERMKQRPVIIEANLERAECVAGLLAKSKVVHGDGSDAELIRRHIEADQIDAVVVLLREAEVSTLIGIFAKSLGARKVIVRCDQAGYHTLAYRLGIDAVLSPKQAIINAVLKYARQGTVESTHLIGEHAAEIIAFRVPTSPRNRDILTKPLREIGFPKGALIGTVVRSGGAFIAAGSTILQGGDELLVACGSDSVRRVETLLA